MVNLKACELVRKNQKNVHKAKLKIGKKTAPFIFTLPRKSEEWYIADYYSYLKDNYKHFAKIGAPAYDEKNVACVAFYFLAELLEQILKPYPYIIGKGLNINLTIFYDPSQEEIMHYYPNKSNRREVHLGITWSYLIECIIHPYFHDQHLHTNRLGRTLLHEFVGHFGDNLTGLDKQQAKTARHLEGAGPQLRMLNEAIFDLRAEGYAHFLEYHNEPIYIKKKWIKTFQKNMRLLVRKKNAKAVEEHYAKTLYKDHGIYHAGMAMCVTIALAKAKKKGVRVRMRPWRWSYDAWARAEHCEVGPIPQKVFDAVRKEVSKCIYPVLFIRSYHEACEELGIAPEHRVLSQRDFFKLYDKAIEGSKHIAKLCKKCPDFVKQYKST